jgi:hypothetical protein
MYYMESMIVGVPCCLGRTIMLRTAGYGVAVFTSVLHVGSGDRLWVLHLEFMVVYSLLSLLPPHIH